MEGSQNIKKLNFQDLNSIEGLQFIPVNDKKIPIVKGWQTLFKKHNLSESYGVGLVCGALSGGLEVIDIDQKYSLDGKLFDNFKRLIDTYDKTLLRKMVVQKTMNGGYHFIYRCQKVEGNLKLANRPTTEQEKRDTYELSLKSNKITEDEKEIVINEERAKKAAINDKVRVLIETRGEGGQVVCFPTKGYEFIFGDFYSIQEITLEERETLHNIARQFNTVFEESRVPHNHQKEKIKGLSPFEDYNNRGDVVSLLETNGWKVVGKKGSKTLLLRPGQTSAQHSGNFDHDKNWFSVFTTSTEFQPQHSYLPYAVYAKLVCKDDFSLTSKKLYEEGYGDRIEVKRELNQTTPSKVSLIDDDLSFLEDDFDEYLDLARRDMLPKGLPTYIPKLDAHFLQKRGELVMINGVDNVGKTIVIIFLQLLAAMYHKWKFVIFSCENTNRSLHKRLMEFYWGKKIQNMNDVEFKIANEFIKTHFKFIKTEEDLYNYKDILNMVKKAMKKHKFDGGLIDPYNGLKIEITPTSKLNTHEYHYEAISEIKQFGTKYDISWFINNHAVTSALRTKGTDGFQKAPNKEDTEGGGKFSNKAAQFITIHRNTQHPTEWMVTDLHIRKVKETETGGKVTPRDMPIRIVMKKTGCGFAELAGFNHEEKPILGIDPIDEFHKKNIPTQITFEEELNKGYTNDFLDNLSEEQLPF
tara:strand:+ start:1399 stop:3483 length:2085 start_codon:yes stop_codon:yes gene_type:complete